MKKAYRVLARLIAALVVVQAAAIAYGAFAIDKVIEKTTATRSPMRRRSSTVALGTGCTALLACL
jgi:hypothetical protein